MRNDDMFDLLWVGKFDFRKQLQLAIRTIAALKDFQGIRLHVLGRGNEVETAYYKGLADSLGVTSSVRFCGQTAHAEVLRMMTEADALLFTSIADETSTVVLEAIGAGLPIICFDACGFGPIVTQDIGRKISLSNFEQSVTEFKDIILELYHQPELLQQMSENCRDKSKTLTWNYKANTMVALYNKVLVAKNKETCE